MVVTLKYHACIKVSGTYCKYWKGLHKDQVNGEGIERVTNYWPIQWWPLTYSHLITSKFWGQSYQIIRGAKNYTTTLQTWRFVHRQTQIMEIELLTSNDTSIHIVCVVIDLFTVAVRPLPQYTDIPYYQKLNTSWFLCELVMECTATNTTTYSETSDYVDVWNKHTK